MYSYVTRMYPFVLVCYPYVTRMYSYVNSVCYSYVPVCIVCNSYVTRMLLVVLVWSIRQENARVKNLTGYWWSMCEETNDLLIVLSHLILAGVEPNSARCSKSFFRALHFFFRSILYHKWGCTVNSPLD